MAGVDLPTFAALLGHTNIRMTMQCVHTAEEHKLEAARKIENLKAISAMRRAEKSHGGSYNFHRSAMRSEAVMGRGEVISLAVGPSSLNLSVPRRGPARKTGLKTETIRHKLPGCAKGQNGNLG
jgi:hypothetical protein